MSYLDLPRLAFVGQFKASPSTVNNATINFYAFEQPEHFYQPESDPPNNLAAFSQKSSFPPEIQAIWNKLATGTFWNPDGRALFSFDGRITSATFEPTTPVTAGDNLIGATVTTTLLNQKFPAKLADLDPDQQTVTGFYGLGVTIKLSDGSGFEATISESAMHLGRVPTLNDLWFNRIPSQAGFDSGASSNIQWVFDEIRPLPASSSAGGESPLLKKFLAACPDGISIRVTLDNFHDNSNLQPQQAFFGRIVGSLGPALPGEPYSFVAGRRIVPTNPAPAKGQYFPANALLKAGVLRIDLANSCPLDEDLIPVHPDRPMVIQYQDPTGRFVPLKNGTVDRSKTYYEEYAGVNDVVLEGDEAEQLAHRPLAVFVGDQPVLEEDAEGRFIMPEQWSLRLSPDKCSTVKFWTLRFGQPAALDIPLAKPPIPQIMGSDNQPLDVVNVPSDGVAWKVDADPGRPGLVNVTFQAIASLPANRLPVVRQWVGSALYCLTSPADPLRNWMQWGAVLSMQQGISVLVWCDGPDQTVIDHPKFNDICRIMQGYAALYPGMVSILDIGDPCVLNNPTQAKVIHAMMSLPVSNPGSMPVTRDLSPANRRMVLNYLEQIIKGGGTAS